VGAAAPIGVLGVALLRSVRLDRVRTALHAYAVAPYPAVDGTDHYSNKHLHHTTVAVAFLLWLPVLAGERLPKAQVRTADHELSCSRAPGMTGVSSLAGRLVPALIGASRPGAYHMLDVAIHTGLLLLSCQRVVTQQFGWQTGIACALDVMSTAGRE
jgi:hypothetical protein